MKNLAVKLPPQNDDLLNSILDLCMERSVERIGPRFSLATTLYVLDGTISELVLPILFSTYSSQEFVFWRTEVKQIMCERIVKYYKLSQTVYFELVMEL